MERVYFLNRILVVLMVTFFYIERCRGYLAVEINELESLYYSNEVCEKEECPLVERNNRINRKSETACLENLHRSFDNVLNQLFPSSNAIRVIMGGSNAKIEEYPHMVALAFYSKKKKIYLFNCGGSLISPTFVLTAAHCIRNSDKNEVKFIRTGTIYVPHFAEQINPQIDVNVKNVIVHENYTKSKKINDIALLELDRSVLFSDQVRAACLYTEDEEPEEAEAIGWGVTKFRGGQSATLQATSVSVVVQKECDQLYSEDRHVQIDDSHICAGNEDKNICPGDSGGPLHIKNNNKFFIVGITSFGDMMCGSSMPGIYTRVSSFLEWIEDNVWP